MIKGNFSIEAKAINQSFSIMMNIRKKGCWFKKQQLNEQGIFKKPVITPIKPYKISIQLKTTIEIITKEPGTLPISTWFGRKAFIESHWGNQNA